MQPPEHLLDLLEAMLAELEEYLGSAELFWPLELQPGPSLPHVPRLTIGGLLLIQDELAASGTGLSAAQHARLTDARSVWDLARAQRAAALERKAGRELQARMRMWQSYLNDLSEKPEAVADYPGEVRNRLMIDRLAVVIDRRRWPAGMESQLQAADRRLESGFRKGGFVLAAPLARVYPRPEFWYLYGHPPPGE